MDTSNYTNIKNRYKYKTAAGKSSITRRKVIAGMGAAAGLSVFPAAKGGTIHGNVITASKGTKEIKNEIYKKVESTIFIDTHEHLPDESARLSQNPPLNIANDWSTLFSHYLNSDLRSAGMSQEDLDRFLGREADPLEKWKLLEPWWPAVKHTGYGQNAAISIRELYGIDEVNRNTIPQLQDAFKKLLKPGLYEYVLREKSGVESCQVNSLTDDLITETDMPLLLMQDLRIDHFFTWFNIKDFSTRADIPVSDLQDWYKVIDHFFEKYGPYAVGVKSAAAYSRDINYANVPAEKAGPLFKQLLDGEELPWEKQKMVEDHLFWYAVKKSNEYHLPVKLHTGYYAGYNGMPLSRVSGNAVAAADLCRQSPETQFVFFHIDYPYYEDLLAVAKQYTNAVLDMCWSWIINPVAAKDFLKKFIVTVPANKVLTFGGDYIPVELVPGHAVIARRGIALALSELVDEQWITLDDALGLTDDIMNGNARRVYDLAAKTDFLKSHSW